MLPAKAATATATAEAMNLLPPVFPLLRDDAAVSDLVTAIGGKPRIYRHGSAKQGTAAPYITWFVVTGLPENSISELPRIDRHEVQIDCWSDNTGTGSRGIETLAQAVRDALEPHAHMSAINSDLRDLETQRYRISMQFTFWSDRAP